jgi:hypothetical protein
MLRGNPDWRRLKTPFGLSNPFKKHGEPYNPVVEGYTQALLNSMGQTPASQDAAMKDLEINIHTIEDEELSRELSLLSITPEKQITIPIYDGLGNKVKDETITYPARPVPWALAARAATSKVMATRFITKQNSIIYKNRLRNEFLKIKRDMTHEDRHLFVPFLNQIELYCLTAMDDAVDGQKMLALKTSGKHLKVGISNGQSGGK